MENNKEKIEISGKVAKFPKNARADHALMALETIKVNPKKLWYVMIESQNNELKMVKYNQHKGVNLYEYTIGIKEYYLNKFKDDKNIVEKIKNITVDGEDVFSVIRNIPTDVILENNQSLLSKITTDLINLLNE